jgi:hypothetical protein
LSPVDEFHHFIEGGGDRHTKHIRKHDVTAHGGLEVGSTQHFPQEVVWSDQSPRLCLIVEHDQDAARDVNQAMGGFLKAVLETDGDVLVVKVKIAKDADHDVTPEW